MNVSDALLRIQRNIHDATNDAFDASGDDATYIDTYISTAVATRRPLFASQDATYIRIQEVFAK